jgi:transcriptional regulator with XRE-family HTH domain
MSIYRTFAENLRKACDTHESIATVCRGTGINRQQFNKYLSAQALPNSRTLSKISSFLKVDEEDLFAKTSTEMQRNEGKAVLMREKLRPLPVSRAVSSLTISDGLYFCYFPLQNQSSFLVRALISVRSRGASTEFVRRTAFRSPGRPSVILRDIKHKGFVLQKANIAYLIGHSDDDCSLLAISFDQLIRHSMHFGLALVDGDAGPVACRICLTRIGDGWSRARHALPLIGIVSVNDTTVETTVVSAMTVENKKQSSHLDIFRADAAFVRQLLLQER